MNSNNKFTAEHQALAGTEEVWPVWLKCYEDYIATDELIEETT